MRMEGEEGGRGGREGRERGEEEVTTSCLYVMPHVPFWP